MLVLHPIVPGADTALGMDEGFSFRAAPVPLRRRIDLRVVKAVAVGAVVLCAVIAFSRWVIDSERRSEAIADAHLSDQPVVGMIQGATVEDGLDAVLPAMDVPARADAASALEAARNAMRGKRTVDDAGPGQLSEIERSLTFTDGPSPAPGIVSVAVSGGRWAAAVKGASGVCYWVSLAPGGASFGSGELCTGLAALSASDASWA
jgi:hypothetical protein